MLMGDKKKRYLRNESLYNLIQENEILLYLEYLPIAVWSVVRNKTLWHGVGRPPKRLYDILICLDIYRYFGFSLRRNKGILKLIKRAGYIPEVNIPCFKTLDNYLNNPEITPYLDELIKVTSIPLNVVEHFFATDSTGISTNCFSSWYSIRIKKKTKKRDHIMAHISSGTKSNTVTAINVRIKNGGDNFIFRDHVKMINKNFDIWEWSGDSAYLSRDNCDAVESVGGEPWFRLKSNTTAKAKGSRAWKNMVNMSKEHPEITNPKYHRRSNVESTNSAKKRKFGSYVRSKNDTAKINEELLGWISYNFTVLGRSKYEFNINPNFAA